MNVQERNRRHAMERRGIEAADALHFVVYGHDEHEERGCLFGAEGGEPCSRDYDPVPARDCEPFPPAWYANTGVGALYGLPGYEAFVADWAGWNVAPVGLQEDTAHWEHEVPVGGLAELAALEKGGHRPLEVDDAD